MPLVASPLARFVLALALALDLAMAPLLAMILVAVHVVNGVGAVAAAFLSTLPYSFFFGLWIVRRLLPGWLARPTTATPAPTVQAADPVPPGARAPTGGP